MGGRVCVTKQEIRSFEEGIGFLIDDLGRNRSACQEAYSNARSRLNNSIRALEKSKDNVEFDIETLRRCYEENRLDIMKRQGEEERAAQAAGVSPGRVDDSALRRINEDIAALNRFDAKIRSALENRRDALRKLERAFSDIENSYSSSSRSLEEIRSMASSANKLITSAIASLSLDGGPHYECDGGGLSISDIGVLAEASSRFSEYAQEMGRLNLGTAEAAADFSSMLQDDVSHSSREIVAEMNARIASLVKSYRSASSSLQEGYSCLRRYLALV